MAVDLQPEIEGVLLVETCCDLCVCLTACEGESRESRDDRRQAAAGIWTFPTLKSRSDKGCARWIRDPQPEDLISELGRKVEESVPGTGGLRRCSLRVRRRFLTARRACILICRHRLLRFSGLGLWYDV